MDISKPKNFFFLKDTFKKIKTPGTDWEKIHLQNITSDKEFVSRMYK